MVVLVDFRFSLALSIEYVSCGASATTCHIVGMPFP